jgi:hypothetical protein
MCNMPRASQSKKQELVLDDKLRELTRLVNEIAPDARLEVSFERYEDEDAHVRVYPRQGITQDEARRVELAVGQRCTEILLETGHFIVGSVYD